MALFGKKKKEYKPKDKIPTVKKAADEKIEEVLPASPAGGPSAPSLPKGGDAHSYQVILSPHITEKGTNMEAQNKYIFRIAKGANKSEIKKALESLYKVQVAKVRVIYSPSKMRQVGRYKGSRPGFKKAIVTLKEGSKIDVAK